MQSLMNFMTGGGGSGTTEAKASTVDVKALIGASTDSLKEGGDKTKGGSLTTVGDVLKDDLKVLMFYFSMHNCPPCREFTPLLAELYKDENESERNMEVIFFSGDPQEDVYNEYYGEMPWKAMPFKDARLKPIARHFKVKGLPRLIVLNAKTMEIIHDDAVSIVTEQGPVILEEWFEKAK